MNTDTLAEQILIRRDIRTTAVRLLVLRALQTDGVALSLTDLETRLHTVDKSSIFRTLTLFQAHHLVHVVEDGSGQKKYALCAEHCHCGEAVVRPMSDLHTHFACERCHRTFCLPDLPVPQVSLPEGFTLHSGDYVLHGLCPECSGGERHKADA